MKILIVSQYFWPETFNINELAATLKRQGHEVTVATGKPNYPDGRIFDGYRALGIQRERYDSDIEVLRVPMLPRGSSGAGRLLLNYASFVISGWLFFPFLLRNRKFDVIFVYAASPNGALPAIPLKWIKGAHLAFWVLDLWPESLSATGYIRNKLLLRAIGFLVRFTYMCADTILVQSRAFIEPIERYVVPDKVAYFPNSYEVLDANDGEGSLPADLIDTLESHFCAVFAGNIGSAQAPEVLVDAAGHLEDLPDVKLVLVGSGSRLEWVRQAVAKRRLANVVLAGRFPPSSMPDLFSRAACLLVTLKDEEIFAYTVPAKVQAYLAAGRPIVAALNGEGARIVREAGAGLTCEAEDAAKLAACVRKLYGMSAEERRKLGEAGRRYFLENFEMSRQARRLVAILDGRRQPFSVAA